jgi:diacylglycerol kinase (ATP)
MDGSAQQANTLSSPSVFAPDPARPFRIILNPTAGHARGVRLKRALDRLTAAGAAWQITETQARGDAEALAEALARNSSVGGIIAAGGDGTINESINGVMRAQRDGITPAPFGLLPLGTANVLAGELGIDQPDSAASALLSGSTRKISLGVCHGDDGVARYFSMMAGVGFDARVVAGINPALKRRFGKGAYVWQTLVEWLRFQPIAYRVTIEGSSHAAASLIIANGHFYAGRFVVTPEANLADPALVAASFTKAGRWAALVYAAALPMGLLPKLPSLTRQKIQRLRVEGLRGEPVQADGDIIGTLPITIAHADERLTIFAPQATKS